MDNPCSKFYIFGSRATNRYKKYSDIDIAIDSPDMTFDKKFQLEIEFENSVFPYEVDIIDLNNINEDFNNLIKKELVELKI